MLRLQGVEATVFGMLMSLHISSFMLGKVFGSALTKAFGVTSGNFANLANLVLVRTDSFDIFVFDLQPVLARVVASTHTSFV